MGGENVTVSWNLPNDPEPNCSTHSFIVTDRDAILADLDLCASGPLVYPGGGTNRTFTLTVSEK